MARPTKQGMDYFPHDTDAASDEKVEALRILYGNDGYAFYFILLERIYRTSSFELDVSDAETRQILAKKVDVTPQKFEEILVTALKRGCFDAQAYEERGVLTSVGVKKRAEAVVGKRQKMAEAYSKRVSAAETPPETRQSKVKESKEKKSKEENTTADAVAPVPAAVASPVESPSELPAEFRTWEHWARENAPQVLRMKSALTASELQKLTADFGLARVQEVCEAMQNHSPLLKKYTSANLTIRDWCKRRASDPLRTSNGALATVARASGSIVAKSQQPVKY